MGKKAHPIDLYFRSSLPWTILLWLKSAEVPCTMTPAYTGKLIKHQGIWWVFVVFVGVLCPVNIYGHISNHVPTCDSVCSWWPYSAVLLWDHTAGTMTPFLILSDYPDTDLTSSCHILVMPSTRRDSDKYKFGKSAWLGGDSNSGPSIWEDYALTDWFSQLVRCILEIWGFKLERAWCIWMTMNYGIPGAGMLGEDGSYRYIWWGWVVWGVWASGFAGSVREVAAGERSVWKRGNISQVVCLN